MIIRNKKPAQRSTANPPTTGHTHLTTPKDPSISQTTAVVKHQIYNIIKHEMKSFLLKQRVNEQLQQYNQFKTIEKENMLNYESRVQNTFSKQKNFRLTKHDHYLQQKKSREDRLKIFFESKNKDHRMKFNTINRNMQAIRRKYADISREDKQARLSKVALNEYNQPENSRIRTANTCFRAKNTKSPHFEDIQLKEKASQDIKVTKYLKKISMSESKMLQKELNMEKTRQELLKKQVVCLVPQRNKEQEQYKEQVQRQHESRMSAFEKNHSRLQQLNESVLEQRKFNNNSMMRTASLKRESFHQQSSEKLFQKHSQKVQKQNRLQKQRVKVIDNKVKSFFLSNRNRIKKENIEMQVQSNIKKIYSKLEAIKYMKEGKKLETGCQQFLLSMVDRSDPEYMTIKQFLQVDREAFIEQQIKKQADKKKQKKVVVNRSITKNSLP